MVPTYPLPMLTGGIEQQPFNDDDLTFFITIASNAQQNEIFSTRQTIQQGLYKGLGQPISLNAMLIKWSFTNVEVRYSEQLVVFLLGMIDRPGRAVAWAYWLWRTAISKPNLIVTFQDWVDEFSEGFPTDDAMHSVWLQQKEKVGGKEINKLDERYSWIAKKEPIEAVKSGKKEKEDGA